MSDLLGSQDIFYHPNFGHLGRKASFSTPTLYSAHIPFCPNSGGNRHVQQQRRFR